MYACFYPFKIRLWLNVTKLSLKEAKQLELSGMFDLKRFAVAETKMVSSLFINKYQLTLTDPRDKIVL